MATSSVAEEKSRGGVGIKTSPRGRRVRLREDSDAVRSEAGRQRLQRRSEAGDARCRQDEWRFDVLEEIEDWMAAEWASKASNCLVRPVPRPACATDHPRAAPGQARPAAGCGLRAAAGRGCRTVGRLRQFLEGNVQCTRFVHDPLRAFATQISDNGSVAGPGCRTLGPIRLAGVMDPCPSQASDSCKRESDQKRRDLNVSAGRELGVIRHWAAVSRCKTLQVSRCS